MNAQTPAPIFSVVIPTYNRGHLLIRAIQSVLRQTFHDFELIIVDDGSTDETKKIVETFRDPRIRYFYQNNKDRSAARNAGAVLALGKYLTFLDSDDEVTPEWLEYFAEALSDLETGIVCCGTTICTERNGFPANQEVRLPRNLGPVYENQKGLFLTGTFALRNELFKAAGAYNERMSFSENTDLAIRLILCCVEKSYRIATIDKPLIIYHNTRPIGGKRQSEERLRNAKYMLQFHGDRYKERSPRGYANYCAIAGVHSVRLGKMGDARHFFIAAIRAYPLSWRHYIRLLLSLFPFLGHKHWLRFK
jgi:glycosyltransferase involved in cell wall biosynthesis